MVVGWLLLSLTDQHDLLHVAAYFIQKMNARIHLPFKETEQWVLDVLHGASHADQLLLTGEMPSIIDREATITKRNH